MSRRLSSPRRGQALVEFGMVFLAVVAVITGAIFAIVVLFQTGSVDNAADNLAARIVEAGGYAPAIQEDWLTEVAELGVVLDPEADQLAITVSDPDGIVLGDCGLSECAYTWNDTFGVSSGQQFIVEVQHVEPVPALSLIGAEITLGASAGVVVP